MTTEIGALIKQFRTKKGLTQTELAMLINSSKTNISNYETGYSKPDDLTVRKISQVLEVDLDKLTNKNWNDLLTQKLYINRVINNYDLDNYNGILMQLPSLANCCYNLPGYPVLDTDHIFATRLTDNSMSKSNLPAGTMVVVRCDIPAKNNTIVAVHIKKEKKIVIRHYVADGGLVMLTDNSYYHEPETAQYYEDDVEVIGTLVKALIDIN